MAKAHVLHIEDVIEPFLRKNSISLADGDPEVALEWCYSKNVGFGPEDFAKGSGVRAWWECPRCGREYKATIANRTSPLTKSGCPFCASKKVCDENSLSVNHPEVAKEWHPKKNKKSASQTMQASSLKAWWLCSQCSHEWQAAPADRTYSKSGCPACYESRMEYARLHPKISERPQIVLDENSETSSEWYTKAGNERFTSLYAFSKSIARQWHPTKNGRITANEIAKGSDAIAWWKCPKGADHEWQAAIYTRTKSRKPHCPFCLNKKLSITNNLVAKAPEIAREWHPKKNDKLRPETTIAGGKHKVWWQCKKNKEHEWETQIYLRLKGSKCPDCTHQRVSKDNCLSKDFPYLAAQLHPSKNNGADGSSISSGSSKKVWWQCPKSADHQWQATPANRAGRGSGCPMCSGRVATKSNCLAELFPELTKQWDKKKNKNLSPDQVTAKSKMSVWWVCKDGHSWQQEVYKRTASKGTCYECRTGKSRPGNRVKSTSPANVLKNFEKTLAGETAIEMQHN